VPPLNPSGSQIPYKADESLGPEREIEAVRSNNNAYPLDQQPDDAHLLGREEFVPERRVTASRTSASMMSRV